MADGVGNNLKQVLLAFKNVIGRLVQQFPLLVFIVIGLLWTAFYYFGKTPDRMTFALSVLVTFVSIIIYAKTKKYGETLLTFMLGLLTIFSAKWDPYKSILFFSFYLGFHAIIFVISSVSLAAKLETELTSAASFIDLKNFKKVYKRLREISQMDTKHNSLSTIERGEAIKFLAFINVPIDAMPEALKNVEYIKVIYQADLKKSLEFFRALFYIKERSGFTVDVTNYLDIIVHQRIPLTPDEFFRIFDKTKGPIIQQKLDLVSYLEQIRKLVFEGHSEDQIVKTLNEVENQKLTS